MNIGFVTNIVAVKVGGSVSVRAALGARTNAGLSSLSPPQDWMKAFEEVKKRRQKELETAALKRSDTITQRER